MQDLSKYTKKTHIEIQTKYLSFLAVVSAALVGLVFAMGVLIGSRRAHADQQPKLDALAVLDRQSGEPSPGESAPPLSFHKELGAPYSVVPTPASLKTAAANESGEETPDLTPAPDPAPRESESPIPEIADRDEPGIYSLQVGSFQDKSEANEMVRNLGRAGYPAFLVSVDMPDRGGLWFRVRVGPYHSKQEAWTVKREFEEKERIPAFVVKRRAEG